MITIAVLLYGADRLVLSAYLRSVWDTANPGEATALPVLLVIAVGTLTPIDLTAQTHSKRSVNDKNRKTKQNLSLP